MKIGSIPLASIILLICAIARFAVSRLHLANASYYVPFFDGMLVGCMLVYLLYYGSIYIKAWLNNRKEALSQK